MEFREFRNYPPGTLREVHQMIIRRSINSLAGLVETVCRKASFGIIIVVIVLSGEIKCLALEQRGKVLASCTDDRKIVIWNVAHKKAERLFVIVYNIILVNIVIWKTRNCLLLNFASRMEETDCFHLR